MLLLLAIACRTKDLGIDTAVVDTEPRDTEVEDTSPPDLDGDGYGADDCDDANPDVNPGAVELCDGVDNDCDGDTDEPDAADASAWYADADGDGYGAGDPVLACEQPSATVSQDGDCDDEDPAFHPGAEESCEDPNDYNCDGSVQYADADGDGFAACEDCDDDDAQVHPDATELCDAVDNDCDGDTDEDDAADAATWYADADGDGFGDPAAATTSCEAPSGTVDDATDCDDSDGAVNPDATELCDGEDNDCDGDTDEDDAADATTWYTDADGDGYGDDATAQVQCDAPSGGVDEGGDCDDQDDTSFPGATELCDGADNDCDTSTSFLEDDPDGDGLLACEEALWVANHGTAYMAPTNTGAFGGSEAAALLTAHGVASTTTDSDTTTLTGTLLADYGVLVLYGAGTYAAYSSAEATALETWVDAGGGLLYVGYHPTAGSCASVASMPSALGVGCPSVGNAWSGSTTTFVTHDITDGLSSVSGAGGEVWTVTSPAQTLASVNGAPFVNAVEFGDGRAVFLADEWCFYNAGTGSADISVGDNETLVDNVFGWLVTP